MSSNILQRKNDFKTYIVEHLTDFGQLKIWRTITRIDFNLVNQSKYIVKHFEKITLRDHWNPKGYYSYVLDPMQLLNKLLVLP